MQDMQGLGKQTEEAVILACQCNSTRFSEERRTARAVVFTCAACGTRTSVQGRVALARVATDEATFAVHKKLIAPAPDAGGGKKARKPSPGEEGFEYLRSKLTSGPDGQAAIVRRACEYVRIMNCDSPEYRKIQWLGTALAYICADFIAGVDPRVVRVYEAQQEAVDAAIARAEANGRKLTRKRATAVANMARDTVAAQLGLVAAAKPLKTTEADAAVAAINADRAAEQAAKDAERASDKRIEDEGQLMDALINVRAEAVARNLVPASRIVIGGPDKYAEILRTYEKRGGYLFRVDGDPRTRTSSGARPTIFVWMDYDYSEHLDLALAYEEQFEGTDLVDPTVEVVELVPANVPSDDMWEQPAFASRREDI